MIALALNLLLTLPTPLDDERLAHIAEFVEQSLAEGGHLGVQVALLSGGQTFSAGFGALDPHGRARMRPDTPLRIASISKCLTAVVALSLADEGRLDLDAEVQRYLPDFPEKLSPITVRQLLGHLSGIRHYKGTREAMFTSPRSVGEALAIFRDSPLENAPGERFLYSSYGYNLLGAVAAAAAGESFAELMQEKVTGPLGMIHTGLEGEAERKNGPAGYRHAGGRFERSPSIDLSARFAAGGSRSTASDLLLFARAVLDKRLVSPGTQDAMLTPGTTNDGHMTEYGLGFAVYPQHGRPVVGHAGGQPETTSLMLIYPADDFALALITNVEGEDCWFRDISGEIVATFLADGSRRRRAYALESNARVLSEAMFKTFNHGLAEYLVHGAPRGSLASSFLAADEVMSPAAIQNNHVAVERKVELGVHPAGGRALTFVGARMAEVLERWRGREHLREYHALGAVPFFADYLRACAELACPESERFSAPLAAAVAELVPTWARANAGDVRRLRVSPAVDPLRVADTLAAAFAGSPVVPDLSDEIGETALALAGQGRPAGARAWLELGVSLYPSPAHDQGERLRLALTRLGVPPQRPATLLHRADLVCTQ